MSEQQQFGSQAKAFWSLASPPRHQETEAAKRHFRLAAELND
jgi:hypothetical protein